MTKPEMKDKCRSLKPTWELAAVIMVALASLMPLADAGTWRDDFENEKLDGWTLRAPHSVWTVQNGFLNAQVRLRGLPATTEFLEFTAFPGPHERFTVTLTNPSFSIDIGLGKIFPEIGGPDIIFFYRFSAYNISACQIVRSGGASVAGFRDWLPKNPGTIWREKVVKLKVHFDAGRFQLFADGALRADFEDSHFDQIEFIAVIITGDDGMSGQLDAFEVSGPGIDGMVVQKKGKVAATWGGIKR